MKVEQRVGLRLTPRRCKRIGEFWEVVHPRLSNGAKSGIFPQSQVTDQHGCVTECVVERVGVVNSAVQCYELKSTSRAVRESPIVVEQTVKVVWQAMSVQL